MTADLLVVGEGLALVDEPVGAAGDGAAPPAGLLLRLGVLQPRLLLAAPRPLLRRVAQLHAAADCLQGLGSPHTLQHCSGPHLDQGDPRLGGLVQVPALHTPALHTHIFDIISGKYAALPQMVQECHLHHAPDGGAEGEPQQVDVLLGDAVALVEGAELGQVGEHAVHLVHVRHHADQQLRGQTSGGPVIGWRIFCYG